MITDLKDYPLSKQQHLVHDAEHNSYILTVPDMRATDSLADWVMGRMERVEVIQPPALRTHSKEKVKAMHKLYLE